MKMRINFGTDKQITHALCCGIFGYLISWVFLGVSLVGPKKDQEGYVIAALIASFDVYPFSLLAYFGIPAFGLGWAFIFFLASYRKRVLTLLVLFAMAVAAYILTSNDLGHGLTTTDLNLQNFRSEKMMSIYIFFGMPLLICLGVLAAILFRPLKQDEKQP